VLESECVCDSVRRCQKVIVSKSPESVTGSECMLRYNDPPSYTMTLPKLSEMSAVE
jgi:hypothetical protein